MKMNRVSAATVNRIESLFRSFALPLLGILIVFFSTPATTSADLPAANQILRKIVFGSCVQQDLPTPIFYTMATEFPDLILFLGDNIYADTEDMTEMRAKYDRLESNADFRRLRSEFPIMATWDDHDFGVNDGGADYPQKEASEKEFLRFWNVSPQSPIRTRSGVYDAKIFGPEGKRVQVIMLDTRYFRSPLKKGERRVGGPYIPDDDPTKTMLGEAQWKWLEQQLEKPAEVRLIGTSIQLVPETQGQEAWGNLPRERQKLIGLVEKTKAGGVLLLSGDRHWAELSCCTEKVPYPIYELTSSSFNQIHPRGTPTENTFRSDDRTYHRENYGVVRIDWTRTQPYVTLEVKDIEGGIRIDKKISIGDLQPN
jgi:alkaline phosphatase D